MCGKAGYKHRYAISVSLEFLAISSFPQLLRCKTDMVASYHVVPYLQCCYAWVVMRSAVHNYWKCYINVATRTFLGFYWYIRILPWALHALGSRAYISVKPLAAVLQYINGLPLSDPQLEHLRINGIPEKTHAQTEWSVWVFKDWASERNSKSAMLAIIPIDFVEAARIEQLDGMPSINVSGGSNVLINISLWTEQFIMNN